MKTLARLALTGAIALAISPGAQALGIAPDGRGQVLIYPYYTVNGGNQTVFSVVNDSDRAKAVQVTAREARNSRDVMRFNLYLGPHDTWTGAIAASGEAGPPSLYTSDDSCTVPDVRQGPPRPFRNFNYSANYADHPNSLRGTLSSLERAREGHIEIIELGVLQTGAGPAQLAEEVTTTNTGLPANCAAVLAAWTTPSGVWYVTPTLNIDLPAGGLYGTASVVDVADGTMFAYDALAIARFYTNATQPGALHGKSLVAGLTDLAAADNGGDGARVDLPPTDDATALSELVPVGATAYDAVSLALMNFSLGNEYNFEATLGAVTEWIVNFPTKRFYTDVDSAGQTRAPFHDAFRDDGKSCEKLHFQFRDRAGRGERIPAPVFDTGFIPPPPEREPELCQATNVIAFIASQNGASAIMGAREPLDLSEALLARPQLRAGTAEMVFESTDAPAGTQLVAAGSNRRYRGLPAIALSVLRVVNANAQPGVLASYGAAYRHRGHRVVIEP